MGSADWYTKSAVEGALNRMPKVKVPMIRRAQGDFDKPSKWAEARHRFVTQLQVCIGDDADISKFIDKDGNVPDCFNKEKLDPISFKGTAWWDEAHKDCHVGDGRDKDSKQYKFPRNELGEYDQKGEISQDTAFYCQFKYNKQLRLALGVAQKEIEVDGEDILVGNRLVPFDYSGKTKL